MSKAGVQVLYNSHIIESKDEITILFKIVIGLDQEARGTISNTYREKNIRNIPKEEQVSECLRRIREETRDKRAVLELIKDKTEYTWFEGDSYIGWYLKGKIAEYADSYNRRTLKIRRDNIIPLICSQKCLLVVCEISY